MLATDVDRAWAVLEAIPDPEIPVVSIRELGILRDVREGEGGRMRVVITPTYSGCPAMEQIEDDVRAALDAAGLYAEVVTQLSPAWSSDWIVPEAREKLRAFGIAPPHGDSGGVVSVERGSGAPGDAPASVVRLAARRDWREAVACPRCGSRNTTETSHFGSTACKSLHRCLDCLEPFDHFKPY